MLFFLTETYYAHGILLTLPVIPSENIWWFAADNPTMDTGTEWYRCNIRKFFGRHVFHPGLDIQVFRSQKGTDEVFFIRKSDLSFVIDDTSSYQTNPMPWNGGYIDHKEQIKCLISVVRKSVATKRYRSRCQGPWQGLFQRFAEFTGNEIQYSSQKNLTMCPIDFSHFYS